MTERSQRQRRTPQLQRPAFLVTVATGGTPAEAVAAAAAPTGLSAEALCRYLHTACYAGHDPASLHGALGLGAQGYLPLPSGHGLTALWEAVKAVGAGYSEAVLVVGWHDDTACCAVVADRETAETLSKAPQPLHVAVAADRTLAVETAVAMAGLDAAPPLGDEGGLARLVEMMAAVRDGGPQAAVGTSGELTAAVIVGS